MHVQDEKYNLVHVIYPRLFLLVPQTKSCPRIPGADTLAINPCHEGFLAFS